MEDNGEALKGTKLHENINMDVKLVSHVNFQFILLSYLNISVAGLH